MSLKIVKERFSKVFYGWWVVAATCAVNAIGGGVYFYGFSVFFLPIKTALNLSSASTSLIFSLSRAEGAVEGPIAGYLIDKFGPRIMLTIGAFIVAIGYILLSQVNSFLWFLTIYLGIISLAFNATFSGSTMAVVNNWFIRRKGLAMAISIAAYSLGGSIIAPLLAFGIHHLGWRTTMALSGIMLAAVVVPFAQLLRSSPEALGLNPDGDTPRIESKLDEVDVKPILSSVDFTVSEALRTKSYWLLAIGTMLRTGTLGTLIVHFVPIMVWKGNSEQTAAVMLGIMAFLSIPMRIGIGWLGDRWSRSKMLAAGMALGAFSLMILQNANSSFQVWLFISVFSVVEGLSALNWALVGDYFGRKRFATLRGILSLVYSWGMIVMPIVAGGIFDRTGSYNTVIWIFVGMYICGTILFLVIQRPRTPFLVKDKTQN
ncbi:MAG: MFS transporter [SAR202 cluster bacterium]|jgi:MFS family permease|nr:MFS transporter [SAR202 cluster bacterium]